MTPADCQRAANQFDAAYRALLGQRRGLLAMPDGTDRRLPASSVIGDMAPGDMHARGFVEQIIDPADIAAAVTSLARRAAVHYIGRPVATFLRIPVRSATSAVAPEGLLPCRAELVGADRSMMQIEIVVRP